MNLPGEGWSQLRQPEGGLALRQALLSIGQNAPRRLALLARTSRSRRMRCAWRDFASGIPHLLSKARGLVDNRRLHGSLRYRNSKGRHGLLCLANGHRGRRDASLGHSVVRNRTRGNAEDGWDGAARTDSLISRSIRILCEADELRDNDWGTRRA